MGGAGGAAVMTPPGSLTRFFYAYRSSPLMDNCAAKTGNDPIQKRG